MAGGSKVVPIREQQLFYFLKTLNGSDYQLIKMTIDTLKLQELELRENAIDWAKQATMIADYREREKRLLEKIEIWLHDFESINDGQVHGDPQQTIKLIISSMKAASNKINHSRIPD